jgi:hypothetical protein
VVVLRYGRITNAAQLDLILHKQLHTTNQELSAASSQLKQLRADLEDLAGQPSWGGLSRFVEAEALRSAAIRLRKRLLKICGGYERYGSTLRSETRGTSGRLGPNYPC